MVTGCKTHDDAYAVAKTENRHDQAYGIKTHRNQNKSKQQETLLNDIAMNNFPIHKELLRRDFQLYQIRLKYKS